MPVFVESCYQAHDPVESLHVPTHLRGYLLRLPPNERPLRFSLDEETYDTDSIGRLDAEYFKVRTTNGKTYLLRYEQQRNVWTLQVVLSVMNVLPDRGSRLSQSTPHRFVNLKRWGTMEQSTS